MSMGEQTTCFEWTTYWPHALPEPLNTPTTDDKAAVTCPACIWALGSQQHPAPTPEPSA